MKKIILMTIACLFIFSTQAFAHTGLESSNPAQGSTVTEALNEITLTYATKIEETGSFKLINNSNESMEITNLAVNDNAMTGTVAENLENGPYKITWKIVGVDGHPIEGEVDFVLNAPIVEEVVEDPATSETAEEPVVSEPEVTEEEAVKEEATTTEVEEDKNGNTGLIIAIVVVLAAAIWFLTRRKNK